MAKKIKSLELNQSMFDRYVEASNARVADRLDDVSSELEMAEESAANATAAAASAVATALAAAKDAARVEESARVSKLAAERRFNELESRLVTLEREKRRAEAMTSIRNRFSLTRRGDDDDALRVRRASRRLRVVFRLAEKRRRRDANARGEGRRRAHGDKRKENRRKRRKRREWNEHERTE
jgi:hypothetical protein